MLSNLMIQPGSPQVKIDYIRFKIMPIVLYTGQVSNWTQYRLLDEPFTETYRKLLSLPRKSRSDNILSEQILWYWSATCVWQGTEAEMEQLFAQLIIRKSFWKECQRVPQPNFAETTPPTDPHPCDQTTPRNGDQERQGLPKQPLLHS
jgi:hypothetical protein